MSAVTPIATVDAMAGINAKCHKRTHAPQQQYPYSITRSARASSAGGGIRIVRIDQQADRGSRRHQVAQQPDALGRKNVEQETDACRVAARPAQICLSLRTRHSAIPALMTAVAQGNKLARRSYTRDQENPK
jgi:hypothetical protein